MEEEEKTTLGDLRVDLGFTPTEVAERMGVTRPRVHVIEYTPMSHLQVGTVDRIVRALSGTLELWVQLADGSRIQLEVDKAG